MSGHSRKSKFKIVDMLTKLMIKGVPFFSVEVRHMTSMLNLGTFVRFSMYLTPKSMSSLQATTSHQKKKFNRAFLVIQECKKFLFTYRKNEATDLIMSTSTGEVKAFLKISGKELGDVT